MAIKVTLNNRSSATRRLPSSTGDSATSISRATYQYMGSLVKNKTLIADYEAGRLPGEYSRLLEELGDLALKRTFPVLHADIVLAEGIEELDEYLGSLGISEEYPYSKDSVDIPNWLAGVPTGKPVRFLVDSTDNTYLTDSNGTEILVRYNT